MARRKKKPAVTIYLIHFSTPYQHAQHYLGSAIDLAARLAQHTKGTGARLMQVINEAGIDWEVARTWQGTRDTEAKFKRAKHNKRLCPLCQQEVGETCTL